MGQWDESTFGGAQQPNDGHGSPGRCEPGARRGGGGRARGRGRGDGSGGRGYMKGPPAHEGMNCQGSGYSNSSPAASAASSGSANPTSRQFSIHSFLKLSSWSNQHQMRRFVQAALSEMDVSNLILQLAADRSSGRNLIRSICEQAVVTGYVASTDTGKRAAPVSFQAVVIPLLHLLSKPEFYNCPASDSVNSIYAMIKNVEGFSEYTLECLKYITAKLRVKDDTLYQDCHEAHVAWLPETWEDLFGPVILFKSQVLQRFWENQNSESELQFASDVDGLIKRWAGGGEGGDVKTQLLSPNSNKTREVMRASERLLRQVNGTLQQKLRREAQEREKQRRDMLFPSESQATRVGGAGRIEIDGPGELSYSGEARHNNDHVRIADISIAPTPEEVLSVRQPYLPRNDPQAISVHHEKDRTVLRHLDIHFRLLRHDLIAPLQEKVLVFSYLKEEQPMNLRRGKVIFNRSVKEAASRLLMDGGLSGSKPSGTSINDVDIFMFQNVTVKAVLANRGTGISYMVEFDDILRSSMRVKDREMFWDRTRRLQHGSLVCLWWAEKSSEFGTQEVVAKPPVLLFGTISIRDIKHLANPSEGRIHVGISMCGNQPFSEKAMRILAAAVNLKNAPSSQCGKKPGAQGKSLPSAKAASSSKQGAENKGVSFSNKSDIVMLEAASNYFAYEPVLKALQTHNELSVPFADYICGTIEKPPQLSLPAYIAENTRYDLQPLLCMPNGNAQNVAAAPVTGPGASTGVSVQSAGSPSAHFWGNETLSDLWEWERARLAKTGTPTVQVDLSSISMNRPDSFPVDQLVAKSTFDRAQALALKAALTQEIVLIQGPPGTGKTYLGVKLIHMLLHNTTRQVGMKTEKPCVGPILCVCFTNHALDQFLEGIINVGVKKVVRVGQRCKNESLTPYNLQEILKRDVDARNAMKQTRYEEFQAIQSLDVVEKEITRNKFVNVGQNWESVKEYLFLFYPDQYESLVGDKHDEDGVGWKVNRPRLSEDAIWSNWLKGFPSRDGFKVNQWSKLSDKEGIDLKRVEKDLKEQDDGLKVEKVRNMFGMLGLDAEGEMAYEMGGQGEIASSSKLDDRMSRGLFQSQSGAAASAQSAKRSGEGRPKGVEATAVGKGTGTFSAFLSNIVSQPERTVEELLTVKDVWSLTPTERSRLFDYWLESIRKADLEKLEEDMRTYVKLRDHLNAVREIKDLSVLRNADVVGMTTSGVAKSLRLVTALGPRIVVVEEAAEVLEAHVLSCLSAATQQLILIGDHLQLRPKVEVYELSKDSQRGYNLDVSLFERLVQDRNFPFYTLEEQRRMRPCIADLVRKTIYSKLRDHPSVTNYPPVRGMVQDLYFWDHDHPESGEEESLGQSRSKYNDYEAAMVAGMAKYLFSQGYKPDDITVLTPYLGQLQRLRSVLSKVMYVHVDDRDEEELLDAGSNVEGEGGEKAEGTALGKHGEEKVQVATGPAISTRPLRESIRIATVDNFQGEESTVVILSLVRNNQDGKIGFLKSANRINVMLTRAKHGLYLIGNSATLTAGRNSKMWPQVLEMMRAKDRVGCKIPLRCEQHPDRITHIERAQDFEELVGDGGCSLSCGFRLTCGHQCPRRCHPDNRNHIGARCLKPCPRLHPISECKDQHPCPKVCGDVCGQCEARVAAVPLPCGHVALQVPCWKAQTPEKLPCSVMVEVKMSHCGHIVKVPCERQQWMRARPLLCRSPCNSPLPCGHNCASECGKCLAVTLQQRLASRGDSDALPKLDPVNVVLPSPYHLPQHNDEDLRHLKCPSICNRALSCGHPCQSVCHAMEGKKCKPCGEKCAVRCTHSVCNLSCDKVCAPCAEPCVWKCTHGNGTCQLPCSAPCDRLPCDRQCEKKLSCGHRCPSICGERCPPKHYCRDCAPADTKELVVDLIELSRLADHDPSEDPLIILPCKHAFTLSSLDGYMGFESVYNRGEDGNWIRACELEQGFTSLKGCPYCRSPITSVLRYGRLINRAFVDQAEKKFIQFVNRQHTDLEAQFRTVEGHILDLTQRRDYPVQDQTAALLSNCMKRLKTISGQFEQLMRRCREPPTVRVYNATVVAVKRKEDTEWHTFEGSDVHASVTPAHQVSVPKPDVKSELCAQIALGNVLGLSMSVEYFWVPHAVELAKRNRQSSELRVGVLKTKQERLLNHQSQLDHQVGFHLEMAGKVYKAAHSCYTEAADKAAVTHNRSTEAQAQMHLGELLIKRSRDMVVELSLWGFLGALPTISPQQQRDYDAFHNKVKGDRLGLLDEAEDVLQKVVSCPLLSLQRLREEAQALLDTEIPTLRRDIVHAFGVGLTVAERREVVRAVRSALLASSSASGGRWYYCENGHPYVIGECGMPMQEARCPECGGQVGGTSHNLVTGNENASEFNEVAGSP